MKLRLNMTDPSGSASTMTPDKADGKGKYHAVVGDWQWCLAEQYYAGTALYTQRIQARESGLNIPAHLYRQLDYQTDPASNMDIGVGNAGVTFKSEGKAPCQGMTCYKYAVSVAATPGTTQTVLFDTVSYKLREWDYSSSSQGGIVMTVSYPSVNITAPSPVQKISLGQ